MKTFLKGVAVAAVTLGVASAASAGTTSVNFESSADKSLKNLGSFSGTATYDDVAGLLSITVNNTSAASGAHLTGLAFNVVGDGSAAYRDGDIAGTRRDEDGFDDARAKRGKRLVKAKPVGIFDAGTGINGKFNPPGRKKAQAIGIAAGSSRTFTFDITGAGALTAADFLGGDMGLVAAFRAKKIDKVGSVITPGSITAPGTNDGNGGEDDGGDPIIIVPDVTLPPGGIIPPINTGGEAGPGTGTGGAPGTGGGPAAVPLPPAAIPAIATFGLVALSRLKRKFTRAD